MEGSHPCDFAAPGAADLFSSISGKRFGDVELFKADVPRTISDQNRPWGRGTDFRNRVETSIVDGRAEGRSVYVIDVHSFPPDDANWSEYDVVVMDPRPAYLPGFLTFRSEAATSLHETLEREFEAVGYVPGSELNDVVVSSRDLGATSFLLEINEGTFAKAPEKIAKVFEGVVEWILTREAKKRGEEARSW